MQHKQFTTQGKTTNSDGEIDDGSVVLTYSDSKTTNGIGEFIDQKAFKKYIDNTYANELITLRSGGKGSSERVIFDIGKTALLFILSQAGCEGIRLMKIKKDDGAISFILSGITGDRVEIDEDRAISKSVKGLDGNDPTRDEEINTFTFSEIYSKLKGEPGFKDDTTLSEIFDLI